MTELFIYKLSGHFCKSFRVERNAGDKQDSLFLSCLRMARQEFQTYIFRCKEVMKYCSSATMITLKSICQIRVSFCVLCLGSNNSSQSVMFSSFSCKLTPRYSTISPSSFSSKIATLLTDYFNILFRKR